MSSYLTHSRCLSGQSSSGEQTEEVTDRLTPTRRSKNMAAIRSKDTLPELTVRRWLHRQGFRYRLHRAGLPGRPDLVFSGQKKVIFVHGCFWHQHPIAECRDSRRPKSRLEYWEQKLSLNVARDARNQVQLEAAGWKVLVVWECETKDLTTLGPRLRSFLKP